MRDRRAEIALAAMDSCRISWGKVLSLQGGLLEVTRRPLVFREGKLALGAAETRAVTWQAGGLGLLPVVEPGDDIAIHWDWACDRLSPGELASLRAETRRNLALANTTL